MENLRGFEIICLSPTNIKGTRVKIKDLRFNKTKIISYDYSFNNIKEIALKYLNKWLVDNNRQELSLEEAISINRQTELY